MNALAELVTADHAAFAGPVAALAELAQECRDLPPGALFTRVDEAVAFLAGELLPHAAGEEVVLYPAVGQLLGSPAATDTMRRDHVEIRRMTDELRRHRDELLSGVLPAARLELERVLYGLHAVLSLHLAAEDELYLPLLAAGPDPGTRDLIEALHAAVADARAADGLAADGG